MRATWKRADLDLTLTEFNIVYLLASRSGEYVTYRAVYDCVHGVGFVAGSGENGFRANVRSSIKRIRIKFRAVDHRFHEIENFAAVGYCWRQEIMPAETDSEDSERARSAPSFRLASYSFGSLKFKLLALIGIFIALPFVFIGSWNRPIIRCATIVTRSIEQQNRLIAHVTLTPSLNAFGAHMTIRPFCSSASRHHDDNCTVLKLLGVPAAASDESSYGGGRAFAQLTSDCRTSDELEKMNLLRSSPLVSAVSTQRIKSAIHGEAAKKSC